MSTFSSSLHLHSQPHLPSLLYTLVPWFHHVSIKKIWCSNTPDSNGLHPWEEHAMEKFDTDCFVWHRKPANPKLVDGIGVVTIYPSDISMHYCLQDPVSREFQVLYIHDLELHWTKIIVAIHSNIITACYVPEVDAYGVHHHDGPMTVEWFQGMVLQFEVQNGKLFWAGLEVSELVEDFKWKVSAMLPTVIDDFNLANYTTEWLIEAVHHHFQLWHLDSYNHALAMHWPSLMILIPLPYSPPLSHLLVLILLLKFKILPFIHLPLLLLLSLLSYDLLPLVTIMVLPTPPLLWLHYFSFYSIFWPCPLWWFRGQNLN